MKILTLTASNNANPIDINIAWKHEFHYCPSRILWQPINWKAMNSDRIKVTKKSCKTIYINIAAILLLDAVFCSAQPAQPLSSQQLEPKGWEKKPTIVSK